MALSPKCPGCEGEDLEPTTFPCGCKGWACLDCGLRCTLKEGYDAAHKEK